VRRRKYKNTEVDVITISRCLFKGRRSETDLKKTFTERIDNTWDLYINLKSAKQKRSHAIRIYTMILITVIYC